MKSPLFDNDEPLEVYLRELRTIPPLTKIEETNLLEHVRAQDEKAESASRTLIEANLYLVVSIVEQYSASGISRLELIQEGNQGLFAALETFHTSKSDSFSVHATNCIREAVSKAISEWQSRSEKR